ncbi:hypothetical protein Q0Z83_000540 [Actinoplanes sichuanensis]|nr:hypothetical protein Q0Z83_000540 [Actinoplanes sichuanensis]
MDRVADAFHDGESATADGLGRRHRPLELSRATVLQPLIADTSLPAPSDRTDWNSIYTITFGYCNDSMIPAVWYPGPAAISEGVEDASDDEE